MSTRRLHRWLTLLIKCGVSAALLFVVFRLAGEEGFDDLVQQPKRWPLLGLATLLTFAAVWLSIVRWFILVRTLDLPFTIRDAYRLGFLGYLLNFVSLGSVGGDLFKAVFLAREQPGRKTEAIATVVIDRAIGLYALLLVATAAILLSRPDSADVPPQIGTICDATVLLTGVGAILMFTLLVPGFTGGKMTSLVGRMPVVGEAALKLVQSIRIYRDRRGMIFVAVVMSCGVHVLLTLALFLIARGLPGPAPGLWQHFLIVPLSMVAAALPLPLAGLGAFEAVLSFLYQHLSGGMISNTAKGLAVALCYRVITVLVAMVGGIYYLANRRDVTVAIHAAEEAG